LLAQREQSRSELRRKLLPHAIADSVGSAGSADSVESADSVDSNLVDPLTAGSLAESEPAETPIMRVEAVLDWLEAHNYLSQERFVESRVHARSGRFGNLRIRMELKQHQVALSPETTKALKDSEAERACSVRERKFPAPPASAVERLKQARFLAGRGFSPEAISMALRTAGKIADAAEPDAQQSHTPRQSRIP
jgi:regulatory protein